MGDITLVKELGPGSEHTDAWLDTEQVVGVPVPDTIP